MIKEIKHAWDNIMTDTARHITLDSFLISKEHVYSAYEKFLSLLDVTGKTIIDYGCGGGWLCKYLTENNIPVKEYIGFDVSTKSIAFAKENNPGANIIEVVEDKIDFSIYNADIFISLYVIQHFPNKEYLDGFLNSLNNSGIPQLLLVIRYADETKFSTSYDSFKTVRLGCWTNDDYLLSKLTNYTKVFDSGEPGGVFNKHFVFKRIE